MCVAGHLPPLGVGSAAVPAPLLTVRRLVTHRPSHGGIPEHSPGGCDLDPVVVSFPLWDREVAGGRPDIGVSLGGGWRSRGRSIWPLSHPRSPSAKAMACSSDSVRPWRRAFSKASPRTGAR